MNHQLSYLRSIVVVRGFGLLLFQKEISLFNSTSKTQHSYSSCNVRKCGSALDPFCQYYRIADRNSRYGLYLYEYRLF